MDFAAGTNTAAVEARHGLNCYQVSAILINKPSFATMFMAGLVAKISLQATIKEAR